MISIGTHAQGRRPAWGPWRCVKSTTEDLLLLNSLLDSIYLLKLSSWNVHLWQNTRRIRKKKFRFVFIVTIVFAVSRRIGTIFVPIRLVTRITRELQLTGNFLYRCHCSRVGWTMAVLYPISVFLPEITPFCNVPKVLGQWTCFASSHHGFDFSRVRRTLNKEHLRSFDIINLTILTQAEVEETSEVKAHATHQSQPHKPRWHSSRGPIRDFRQRLLSVPHLTSTFSTKAI